MGSDKPRVWLISLMGIVLFFGTGLAVMYFNEDVEMASVLNKIFKFIAGREANIKLLTTMYCIGIAIGVVGFFNPIQAGNKGRKPRPRPMEVKYFEYEEQVKQCKKGGSGDA